MLTIGNILNFDTSCAIFNKLLKVEYKKYSSARRASRLNTYRGTKYATLQLFTADNTDSKTL